MERMVIVGAGTFGASLAWLAARAGHDVVLVDQFRPGDSRATSGGESRLLRSAHGADEQYARSARRARELWRELEAESGDPLFEQCGVDWFAHTEHGWEATAQRVLEALKIPVVAEAPELALSRYPSLGIDDLAFVLHEPEAGIVRAQRAVRALAARAGAHGARLVRARALPRTDADPAGTVALDSGEVLEGDRVVWSCGCWLRDLFGDLLELRVTRQELFFFGGGPGWERAPGWVDYDGAMYGTGDVDGLGVKAAWDGEGPAIAPDDPLPDASTEGEHRTREYLAVRFPALADAPLSGAKSCRYEITLDSNFVVAPHPDDPATWLLGGGSGHGFKHGPAVAEQALRAWGSGAALPARYRLEGRRPGGALRSAGTV